MIANPDTGAALLTVGELVFTCIPEGDIVGELVFTSVGVPEGDTDGEMVGGDEG